MEHETHVHPGVEKLTAGSNSSVWVDSVQPLAFKKLEENAEADVVIVGGGIAGISVAYCLVRSGKKVIVVEDGFIGSGETGRTTAHLVTALDDRYYQLLEKHGEEKTKLIAESHKMAIDFVERTVRREGIDCDFKRVNGYLFFHPSDEVESFAKEYDAATKAGIDVGKLELVPGMENYYGPCLRFTNQAQFHPLKYLAALCGVIEHNGGSIYTNAHVTEVKSDGVVTDKGFKIKAKQVVVATNTPINNRFVMHMKQFAYRTYVVGAKIKKNSIPASLWWDSGDFSINAEIPPYHYVRIQKYDNLHDLLIVGGEDHATGDTNVEKVPEEDRYALLETWARQYFPISETVYKWSGQVMEPMGGLAYIGKNPFDSDNIYIVTGDSGNGMTHGVIAGMLIDDLINERENKFEDIYSPSRLNMSDAGKIFMKEFVGGIKNYFKNKDKEPENKLNDVAKNEGKIVEMNDKKYGVFRDEEGHLHFVGSECTHLQCGIKWNNDEKSWDCPCHGSRFTYEGKVINGPANKDLPYHKEAKTFRENKAINVNKQTKKEKDEK